MDKSSKGFIKLDRAIFEHWIFQDAEKFKAFVDLIQLMRFKDETLIIGNDVITIPRGSFYTSELKLAERWGWSRKKVRSYIDLLSKEGMLIKKGTTKGTMLTLVNYDFYQGEGTTKGTSKEHQKNNEGTSKEHQKNIEGYTKEERKEREEIKEGKEMEEITSTSPLYYPSPTHKLLANYLTDVCYRTFFNNADIVEENEVIKIKPDNKFSKGAIEKYVPTLEIQIHKKIEVI
ncbi:hypothetical protein QDR11_14895 [Clostridium perfringens]|uniref:hypothetical protein n=1 Tax=Clostridium perfringens TaxID=1502 RepID=UPI001CB4A694|nr:hypothetical protein [Clostridium perfringens]EIF6157048.1 hypothetical protein [Clostridium perfringens]MDH2472782.1 hypothetical protein [Clostridium perfringens]MDU6697605.1 hypothetical protein [Clostridium perfringens]HBI7029540.1 hypothetical protein [Clostridium perfringens]